MTRTRASPARFLNTRCTTPLRARSTTNSRTIFRILRPAAVLTRRPARTLLSPARAPFFSIARHPMPKHTEVPRSRPSAPNRASRRCGCAAPAGNSTRSPRSGAKSRTAPSPPMMDPTPSITAGRNGCSILLEGHLAPGDSHTYPILIAWHFPNCYLREGGIAPAQNAAVH